MTIVEFLLARIAEDEAAAREAAAREVAPLGETWDMGGTRLAHRFTHARLVFASADGAARQESDEAATAHFARHDPARVLRECEAKRRIVDRYADCDDCGAGDDPCVALRALGSIYADHPNYRSEWA